MNFNLTDFLVLVAECRTCVTTLRLEKSLLLFDTCERVPEIVWSKMKEWVFSSLEFADVLSRDFEIIFR